MKTSKTIQTDTAIKADASVAADTKAPAVVKPYAAIMAALPNATVTPKAAFDACVTFAQTIGAPSRFADYRDEVLSAVGRLTGTAKWSGNGARASVSLKLTAAMASVVKHDAAEDPDSADAVKAAAGDLKRTLAILAAVGGASDFTIAGE